jgi:hypothetical protein
MTMNASVPPIRDGRHMRASAWWTRERVCSAYIAISVVIALLTPVDFAIENYVGFDVSALPWLHTMMMIPGRLPSLTTYFTFMWMLFPGVVWLLFATPTSAVPVDSGPRRFEPMRTWKFAFALWVCVAMFIYAMYGVDLASPSPSRGYLMFATISRYRIFLGFGGGVIMMGTALTLCGAVFHIVLLSRRDLS